jgi:hypothetical protein
MPEERGNGLYVGPRGYQFRAGASVFDLLTIRQEHSFASQHPVSDGETDTRRQSKLPGLDLKNSAENCEYRAT